MEYTLDSYLNDKVDDAIKSEIITLYELAIEKYTNKSCSIISKRFQYMIDQLSYEYVLISPEAQKSKFDYDLINKQQIDYQTLKNCNLPYYYIVFIKKLIETAHHKHPISILLNDNLQKEYNMSLKNRKNKHILLMTRYIGMGHYLALSVLTDKINNSLKNPIYFVSVIGGENELTQMSNLDEYNKLNETVLTTNNKLKSLNEALIEMVTYKFK